MNGIQSYFDDQSFRLSNKQFDNNIDKYCCDHQIKKSDIIKK